MRQQPPASAIIVVSKNIVSITATYSSFLLRQLGLYSLQRPIVYER